MRLLLSFLLLLSATEQLLGGQRPQAGRTKILLTWADSRSARLPFTASAHGGAEVIERPSYRIIALSPDEVTELEQRLRGEGILVTRRDDFDMLFLPGGQIDTRRGSTVPRRRFAARVNGDDPKVVGLHVVQLVAPPTDDWLKELQEAGGRIVHYVPQNGYVIAADDEQAAAVDALPFVQWVSPFDSGLKARPSSTEAGSAARWIEVAVDTDVDAALDALRAVDSEVAEVSRHPNRIVVEATLDAAAVEQFLAAPQIISITDVPAESTSDERQAQSATTNVNAELTQPTNPGTYKTWLGTACPYCTNLLAENFLVGFADTGIDAGELAGNTHPDLGTRVRYGADFATSIATDRHKDISGHGTMVAGILAGDGVTNATDSGSFLLGVGIAPSAGVLSTRIWQGTGLGGGPFQWAFDATSRGAYVQNHSHNSYADGADGHYLSWSPMFDEAVRDSNGFSDPGGSPVSLVVSAGNREKPVTRPVLGVLPGATGKNVIAVGGVENYRPVENLSCNGTSTEGFKFISRFGKFSTNVDPIASDGVKHQWSTYLKPDITAPMSNIFSAQSASETLAWCYDGYNGRYLGTSGTSFAAPAVAGAALLARRVYANFRGGVPDPAAASPALVKAMLIASARSLEGGTVRDNGTTSEVLGPRPDDRQGFGLLSLVDIMDANAAKSYVNQTYNFTSSGQTPWKAIYYRRNPNKPARVALTWTDAPAAMDANPPLVNNLDLTVNRPYAMLMFSGGVPVLFPCYDHYPGNNIAPGDNSMGMNCMSFAGMGSDYRNNAELVSFMSGTVFSPVYVAVNPSQIVGKANPDAPGLANQDFALYAFNLSQRGDLNHNGKVDLIFRHPSADNRPFVWLDVTTNTRTYLGALAYPWTIEALGDFDQNGSDDLVIRHPTSNEVQIRLLNKTATLSTGSVATAPAGYEVAGAGDFNMDGNVDILLRAYSGVDAGKIQIWRMVGATRFEVVTLANTMADTNYRLEASADFNGDGHADYLWHHLTSGAVQIWYMANLTVQSTASFTTMAPTQWRVGAVGDYNDDSVNDIVWRNQTTGQAFVFYGDRTGFPTSGSLATESTLAWKTVGPR